MSQTLTTLLWATNKTISLPLKSPNLVFALHIIQCFWIRLAKSSAIASYALGFDHASSIVSVDSWGGLTAERGRLHECYDLWVRYISREATNGTTSGGLLKKS
jgi:hypothetical protein